MDAKRGVSALPNEPAYMKLYRSGELARRVESAIASLAACEVCPRKCRANRLENKKGFCRTGRAPVISSFFPHLGEENCLRGRRGSGTIFFSLCNLNCVFCQNSDISQGGVGSEVKAEQLAAMMIDLQEQGCHNINFVTPEHCVPQVLESLLIAVGEGLRLPIVYNTSAYDSLHSLELLDGVVDIYMPDFKIWDEELSNKYLKAGDYPETARQAIKEMHRQVGPLVLDETGLAVRGVLVRHLVMPAGTAGTPDIMQFLASLSVETYVNIMAQYHPANKVTARNFPELNRPVTGREMEEAFACARKAGLHRFDERHRLFF